MEVLSRTSTMLLDGLRDVANEPAWSEFDRRFRPIVRAVILRLGLSPTDADDATQETMARFVKHYREGRYDRERGRLSAWIVTIARNCVLDLLRARANRREYEAISAAIEVADDAHLSRMWGAERERVVVARAMSELRASTRFDERTIRAFEMVAFEGRRPADAAAALGLTADSVYAAKNRCVGALREFVQRFEALYDE